MCCATTMGHGKSAGSRDSTVSSAGGPPVETPISTRPWAGAALIRRLAGKSGARRRGAGADADCAKPLRSRTRSASLRLLGRRARDAARTVSTSLGARVSISSEMAPSGFVMKSTAPSSSAARVTLAPASVREETITTGHGCSSMILSRQARPSISGMFTSSVTTSGLKACNCSNASTPLRARAISKSPSAVNTPPSRRRIRGESSTMSSRITKWAALGRSRSWRQADPSPPCPAAHAD